MTETSALILVAITLAAACSSTPPPPPRYVRAEPVPEVPRPPAVVQVPMPMPLPGQLQRLPNVPRAPGPTKPCLARSIDNDGAKVNQTNCREVATLIDKANEQALQNPDEAGFFNAVMAYDFAPGALYQVYTAPLRLTAITLQPGEKVVGKPAAGDTVRWVVGIARSMSGGVEQQHIFIKPTRPGLDTTLVITTDRRIYHLELHSFQDTYMASVAWRYPQDEIAQLEAQAAEADAVAKTVIAPNVNLDAANFRYDVTVKKGKPVWKPEQVFDDGKKTYIRFPRSMLHREAPALFVVSSANETQLVNYRVRNEYYIVDRLFETAELRLGQQDQEIVRVARK